MSARAYLTAFLLVLAAATGAAPAAICTWNGTSGDWFDGAKWTNGIPGAGDDAVILTGTVLLTNETTVASFTQRGGSLVFSNWSTRLTATDVTLASNATNTCSGPFSDAGMSNRVWIVCTNLTLNAGAFIHADSRGYLATNGPGAGFSVSGYRSGGGGHGGKGGVGSSGAYPGLLGGPPYGTLEAPTEPGSGAGNNGTSYIGGSGGGAVRLEVALLATIDGTISANGQACSDQFSGAGSGGSVYLTCRTLAGSTGLVRANGGGGFTYNVNGNGGEGAGGRIAIAYDPEAQAALAVPQIQMRAQGGRVNLANEGDLGTIHLPDAALLTAAALNNFSGQFPAFTNWNGESLSLSSGWIRFPADGFVMTVTNDLSLSGTARLELGGNRYLPPPQPASTWPYAGYLSFYCAGRYVYSAGSTGVSLLVGGNLTMTNLASIYLYSTATNASLPDAGAWLTVDGIATLSGTGSCIYPVCSPTNGGAPLLTFGELTVNTQAAIRADGRGHPMGYGAGRSADNNQRAGGAGHGGQGGKGVYGAAGGIVYGSSNAPVTPGSPPGKNTYISGVPKWGGGVVRIVADNVWLSNGVVSASAEPGDAGSGGSIWINAGGFGGKGGTLTARGGNSPDATRAGGGGGGRIAIWRAIDAFEGEPVLNVDGGTGYEAGTNGTVVWLRTSPTVTNLYATNTTASTSDLVGDLVSTGTAPAELTCYWGTNDGGEVKGAWMTNDYLGAAEPGPATNPVSGLSGGTLYYFRFYATNAHGDGWGVPTAFFSTPGGISVDNADGATNETATTATLRGTVVVGNPAPDAYFCWGDEDPGGTSTAAWDHVVGVGPTLGAFETALSGLLANKTYFYRCYAQNDDGDSWAPAATTFTTLSPTIAIADPAWVTEGDSGTLDVYFAVTLSATSAVDVTVAFTASNGLAAAGSDFAPTSGVVRFTASNSVAETVRVQVIGDTDDEFPYEDFYVVLASPASASLDDPEAYVRVLDTDDAHQTKVWTGTGDWFGFTNWSPIGRPGPLDDALVASGSVLLTNAVAVHALAVAAGATLTMSNWTTCLTATDVAITGTVTLPPAFASGQMSNRVWFSCATFSVAPGGIVTTDARGYTGQNGPGAGQGSLANRAGGGGHGGQGGHGYNGLDVAGYGGRTYGSAAAPNEPGSGGGPSTLGAGGRSGGGVIRIEASGAALVEGTLSANGASSSVGANDGAGAGGSVYLACATLAGTGGLIRANGGASYGSSSDGQGGGGGGRIAVLYDPALQSNQPVPEVRFQATSLGTGRWQGDLGTLYFPDARLAPPGRLSSFSGQLPNVPDWSADALTLTSGWVRFTASGFRLTVTNNLTLSGSGTRLDLGGDSYLDLRAQSAVLADHVPPLSLYNAQPVAPQLEVGGRLTLTNSARLVVVSAATNAGDEYGALVTVGGALTVGTNCWVMSLAHLTNGGSACFSVGDLFISTSGGFDSRGAGYAMNWGQGKGTITLRGGGGSYGGRGGVGSDGAAGGLPYGSSNAPVEAGSGGGSSTTMGFGGWGGGSIRIESVDRLQVDGTLNADASAHNTGTYGGGGAGGGIYLRCRILSGSGLLTARGMDGYCDYGVGRGSGAGGGGRIAVYFERDDFFGTTSVTNGIGWTNVVESSRAQVGTIVWKKTSPPGTVLILH